MYWRICPERFDLLCESSALDRASAYSGRGLLNRLMNPLWPARALATPFAGEEGDQGNDVAGRNHA